MPDDGQKAVVQIDHAAVLIYEQTVTIGLPLLWRGKTPADPCMNECMVKKRQVSFFGARKDTN